MTKRSCSGGGDTELLLRMLIAYVIFRDVSMTKWHVDFQSDPESCGCQCELLSASHLESTSKSLTMHPYGGISICPRCEKRVYAAEQVRSKQDVS